MALSFVSDQMALAIALSAGFPPDARQASIPSYGVYIVYNNARYLVKPENGLYKAVDISVYAEDGTLLTDATDVYLNALKQGALESAQAILAGIQQAGGAVLSGAGGALDLAANLKWILIGGLALFIIVNAKKFSL